MFLLLSIIITITITLVQSYEMLSKVLLLQGRVTTGYGRGSKKLGVPTANLPHFHDLLNSNNYQRGVYFGWGTIDNDNKIYGCVANIGISPTFVGNENAINIVEAHLLDRNSNVDFYGNNLRLALVSFLRPEQKFQSFDALINQINNDVNMARTLRDNNNIDDNMMIKPYNIAKDFFSKSFDNNEIKLAYQESVIFNSNINTNNDNNSQAVWCTVTI